MRATDVPSSRPVVMFGAGPLARTILYFLTHDSPYDVVAVTVDRDRITDEADVTLPLVPFEEVLERYPPTTHDMFIALGYRHMNRLRAERFRQAKAMGYRLVSHVSPRASTWPDLSMGENCLILDDVIVHPYVRIGDDTLVWSGSHVGHRSVIGDHCFLASRSALSGSVTVGDHSFLGTNCTIRDGITVGEGSAIGAGATISADTEPWSIYAAAPVRKLPGRSDRLPRF